MLTEMNKRGVLLATAFLISARVSAETLKSMSSDMMQAGEMHGQETHSMAGMNMEMKGFYGPYPTMRPPNSPARPLRSAREVTST